MDQTEERPTLAERYVSAAGSSHLKVESGRCDTDYLMAFALSDEPFGVALIRLRAEYDTARAEVRDHDPQAAHVLAMLSVRSFDDVKERTERMAMLLNTEAWTLDQDAARRVACRVLDAWLDPLCRACDGRGTNGGKHRGERVVSCKVCSGTGKRRTRVASTGEEQRFAAMLRDRLAESQTRAQDVAALRLQQQASDSA